MINDRPLTTEEVARFQADLNAYLARVRAMPEEIRRTWPEVRRADCDLAMGQAIALPQKEDERSARRTKRAVGKLHREPAFQAEVKRLAALVGPSKPHPSESDLGRNPGCIADWLSSEDERVQIVHRESHQFAIDHQFPYIARAAVVVALVDAVNQCFPGEGVVPPPFTARFDNQGALTIYVNPLPDTDVSAPVGPGRILVDLTDASYDDLTALAPVLAEVQARLGYMKQRGRQYEGNAEQMAFVHELRTSTSGRGRKWTWKQIRDKFHKKFGENVAEATLKQRYLAWQRWNESTA
jgi:hypothetical protein